jgi:murein DD-endopeptidase MepM/ murein hydrolase activator NlpD
MSRTFNVLLVVGCFLSVAAAFIFTVKPAKTTSAAVPEAESAAPPPLPPLTDRSIEQFLNSGIEREIQLKTQLQDDVSYEIREYKAQSGDSLWSIAQQFDLEPETILWGNEWLSSVGVLQIGDTLKIMPTDGVLHTVKEGDTLETLERLHGTPQQEIFEYFGNEFDLTLPPDLKVGQQIIVPNGTSPIVWSEAQAPVVETTAASDGEYPNLGTGYFVWPVAPPYLLTQEYWGGHPAIDINTYFRQPIFASDSGTVRFSGWNDTGYGNLVIIDHGNGYRTYYAHNEANLVSAGQVVVQGQQIAESGSTGNSTGNHLDFRIYYGGSFFNPLEYLP